MNRIFSTRWFLSLLVFTFIFTSNVVLAQSLPSQITYDIVYVKAPRKGDDTFVNIPEVFDPIKVEAGSDLVLLHPDGSEEVLVTAGKGAILDPVVSFDSEWVYYSKVHDQTNLNSQRRLAARSGADIFKINLETRAIIQLTFQEWTPNTGVANWSDSPLSGASDENILDYGIYNLGPCPLPGGKVMFTSSRNGFLPNKSFTFPNLQLFVMDEDGKNVELVAPMNLGSALHPTILKDGRVMFSSYEAQGGRDRRLWGLWSIWPDGRKWAPLISAFSRPSALHWQTQLSDGSIVVDEYYNLNNSGFGTFLKFPPSVPPGTIAFGDPDGNKNPPIPSGWFFNGKVQYRNYSFSPYGLEGLTPFTIPNDRAAPFINGTGVERTGKVTQPSGAPNNDLLLVWSPGPANRLNRPVNKPVYDAGLYLQAGGVPVNDHRDLILIKNDPNFNEQQPRAVVPYQAIYGVDEPVNLPWLPNDGSLSQELPEGTPYGLIGTSSFYKRNTTPGKGSSEFGGLDPFNTSQNGVSTNWASQGADAGKYDNSDIYAVRILAMEPTSHLSYGPGNVGGGANLNFQNEAHERLRILGEIPLRKYDAVGNPILDIEGNPDTSFLAKIPADVPYTFQTLDKNGMVLNASQTWHQVRPGEIRNDCGGCHAHAQTPLVFSTTEAAKPGYQIMDLANATPLLSKDTDGNPELTASPEGAVDVEYYRDIKPILQRSCVQCHSENGRQEAGLVLDDESIVNSYENTYNRLADDRGATYGIPPLVRVGSSPVWRQTNQSRYIRGFQSRRSLLAWKIFGQRLDGWTNEDHPSAATPGDATTLPGWDANDPNGSANRSLINRSDLDFTGTIMPPPNSGVAPLTEDEKILFARWIDLGSPITSPGSDRQQSGWFADELRPTLTISSPRAGRNDPGLQVIRIGAHDFYSKLDMGKGEVTANFDVNGFPAGTNLIQQFASSGDHIWSLNLTTPIDLSPVREITVKLWDNYNNVVEVKRSFFVSDDETPPDALKPPTPQSFAANVISDSQIDLSWDASVLQGETIQYRVFANGILVADTPDLSFQHTGLSFDTEYNYQLYAYDSQENLSDPAIVAGRTLDIPPPSTPANFVANVISESQVDLSWDASTVTPTNGSIAYRLYADGVLVLDSPSLSFQHTGLNPETDYSYELFAYDANGNTSQSATAQARTLKEQLTASYRVVARDQSGNEVPNATLSIYGVQENIPSGTEVELENGKTYYLQGSVAGIKGSSFRTKVSPDNLELVVPFQTMQLNATDQNGQAVSNAELIIYKLTGTQSPGSSITFPQGSKVYVRGRLNKYSGPSTRYAVNADTSEINIPFQTIQLNATDQNGQAVSNAELIIYKLSGTQSPGSSITFPQGSKVYVRGRLNKYSGPSTRYAVNADTNEINIPFQTVQLNATDQNGQAVSNAELIIYKLSGTHSPGSSITFPQGSKVYVRGRLNGSTGPSNPYTIKSGTNEIVVVI
jgi:chitodextrinase